MDHSSNKSLQRLGRTPGRAPKRNFSLKPGWQMVPPTRLLPLAAPECLTRRLLPRTMLLIILLYLILFHLLYLIYFIYFILFYFILFHFIFRSPGMEIKFIITRKYTQHNQPQDPSCFYLHSYFPNSYASSCCRRLAVDRKSVSVPQPYSASRKWMWCLKLHLGLRP